LTLLIEAQTEALRVHVEKLEDAAA
jgi:hypothetical protein